jgi:membrane-bound lytic murein transglycosylase B
MDRKTGRPSLGLDSRGNFVRFAPWVQERVEAMARASGVPRAAIVRALVTAQLAEIRKLT